MRIKPKIEVQGTSRIKKKFIIWKHPDSFWSRYGYQRPDEIVILEFVAVRQVYHKGVWWSGWVDVAYVN